VIFASQELEESLRGYFIPREGTSLAGIACGNLAALVYDRRVCRKLYGRNITYIQYKIRPRKYMDDT